MKWPTSSLDCIAILDRQSIHPSEVDAATPYLGLEHLDGDGGIDCTQTIGSAELKSNKFQFSDRHVLFGKLRPYLRKIVRPEFSGVCSTDIIPILPKEGVSRDYLFYFLRTPDTVKLATSRCSGVNLPRLSPKQLASFRIPLPPFDEQKQIVEILDKADALRAKRRDSLAQFDTLTQSIFLDMFGDPATNPKGWEVHGLTNVFWLQEGPGVRNWQFKESGIKLLNVSNILKSGELDLSKTDRHLSTDEVQKKYSHFLVEAGDLVIASSGISIDWDNLLRTRSAFVKDEHLPLCMNTSTVRFKATHGVSDLRFLQHWLQSHEFRRQITREVTGSAQKNFGPTHLKRLRITLPPFDLQCRFAAIVESVKQRMTSQRAHLAEIDTLFASLQHRAFRGEL